MKGSYNVQCHCRNVRGVVQLDKEHIVAWECDCSDCRMRGNVHVIVPESAFRLNMPGQQSGATREDHEKELGQKTILYLWGTKTAKRQFCKRCGILPWYRPRSNPDGYGITVNCIDFDNPVLENTISNSDGDDDDVNRSDRNPPKIEFRKFDGQNWERFFEQSGIAQQSKDE